MISSLIRFLIKTSFYSWICFVFVDHNIYGVTGNLKPVTDCDDNNDDNDENTYLADIVIFMFLLPLLTMKMGRNLQMHVT